MTSKLAKTATVVAAAGIAYSGAQGVASGEGGSLARLVGSVENNSSVTLKLNDLNGALLIGGGLAVGAAAAVAAGVAHGTIQLPEGIQIPGL